METDLLGYNEDLVTNLETVKMQVSAMNFLIINLISIVNSLCSISVVIHQIYFQADDQCYPHREVMSDRVLYSALKHHFRAEEWQMIHPEIRNILEGECCQQLFLS